MLTANTANDVAKQNASENLSIPEVLLQNNRQWASAVSASRPKFFEQTALGQSPKVLWIGCSDSRVPANEIVGLGPNKIFVHRNVAALVHSSDVNALAVIQYSVEHLKVEHIVVCGHTNCGGVGAALSNKSFGDVLDAWLRQIKDVYAANKAKIDAMEEGSARTNALVELSVASNVLNVAATSAVQAAWASGQSVTIHGWVYELETGHIKETGIRVDGPDQISAVYRA